MDKGVYLYDDRIFVENRPGGKDGETLGVLIIKDVQRKDDGLYECMASNSVSRKLYSEFGLYFLSKDSFLFLFKFFKSRFDTISQKFTISILLISFCRPSGMLLKFVILKMSRMSLNTAFECFLPTSDKTKEIMFFARTRSWTTYVRCIPLAWQPPIFRWRTLTWDRVV